MKNQKVKFPEEKEKVHQMKEPTPEQAIVVFLEKETVRAEGKSVGAFSLYYRYTKHSKMAPPYRTVATMKFYQVLKRHGYRRIRGDRGFVFEDIQLTKGA